MVELLIGIIFLLIVATIAFLITYWLPILLGILTAASIWITIYSIYFNALKKRLARVVKAYLVGRAPITKKEKEVIGYEENAYYYPYWHSEIFRYIDVIVGYRVRFSVVYEDGERDTITCKEGDYAYRKLMGIVASNQRLNNENENIPIKKFLDPTYRAPSKSSNGTSTNTHENVVAAPKSLWVETVRKNLTVDEEVFRRHGMVFKCNLVSHYSALQLNFEISNTKQFASKIGKQEGLKIKANAYDAEGNLLCMEDEWIPYSLLKSGYASDYFYFSSESINGANSIKVYAIDPVDEDKDTENTDVVVFEQAPPRPIVPQISRKKQEERKIDPNLDYDATYTYCQVALNEGGRTYSYRTSDPELKVGDMVYVPFGYKNQERVGTIVSMEDVVGRDAPYPLEKTKCIIGKVE